LGLRSTCTHISVYYRHFVLRLKDLKKINDCQNSSYDCHVYFLYFLYKGAFILDDVIFTKKLAIGSTEYYLLQLIAFGYIFRYVVEKNNSTLNSALEQSENNERLLNKVIANAENINKNINDLYFLFIKVGIR